MSEHVDVLIVGAGLSGIGAAHHIQAAFPDKTYAILEARDAIGGTWDLFRYPGVRSDSDMYTLGYRFRPWTQGEAIADGPSILNYVRNTATEAAIDKHIRFSHRVTGATWSSATARWTVQAVHGAETRTLTCGFLLMCSGYYALLAPHRGRSAAGGGRLHHRPFCLTSSSWCLTSKPGGPPASPAVVVRSAGSAQLRNFATVVAKPAGLSSHG